VGEGGRGKNNKSKGRPIWNYGSRTVNHCLVTEQVLWRMSETLIHPPCYIVWSDERFVHHRLRTLTFQAVILCMNVLVSSRVSLKKASIPGCTRTDAGTCR
jgi:hypothetical protein